MAKNYLSGKPIKKGAQVRESTFVVSDKNREGLKGAKKVGNFSPSKVHEPTKRRGTSDGYMKS